MERVVINTQVTLLRLDLSSNRYTELLACAYLRLVEFDPGEFKE